MRTTVVPAQITTVEDKIAGSFSMPQIVLLVIALVIGAVMYEAIPPKLHFGSIKMILVIIEFAFFGILALRFNGKIVADWLIIYLRYSLRPRRYIFTKNDLVHREIVIEQDESVFVSEEKLFEKKTEPSQPISLSEQIKIDQLFKRDALSVSFKMSKKGGIDVSLKQVKS